MVGFGTDKKTVVTGVEMFRKLLDDGQAGDNVGLLLRGWKSTRWSGAWCSRSRGRSSRTRSSRPKSTSSPKRKAGGIRRSSRATGPSFYFRTTDVTGSVELPAGVEMVMPGDNTKMTIELITPIADGRAAALRDSGRRPDGRGGVVTKILK